MRALQEFGYSVEEDAVESFLKGLALGISRRRTTAMQTEKNGGNGCLVECVCLS